MESHSSGDAPSDDVPDVPSDDLPDAPSNNTDLEDVGGTRDEVCEHEWNRVVIPPTCTTSGAEVFTCLLCNESYNGDESAAPYHTYDGDAEFLTDNEYHWQECPSCGDIAYRDTHWFGYDGVCRMCGFNRD